MFVVENIQKLLDFLNDSFKLTTDGASALLFALLSFVVAAMQFNLSRKGKMYDLKSRKGYFLLGETNKPTNSETQKILTNHFDLNNPLPFFVAGTDDIFLVKTKVRVNDVVVESSTSKENICFSLDKRFNKLTLQFTLDNNLFDSDLLRFDICFWMKNSADFKYKQKILMILEKDKFHDWYLLNYNFCFSRWHCLWLSSFFNCFNQLFSFSSNCLLSTSKSTNSDYKKTQPSLFKPKEASSNICIGATDKGLAQTITESIVEADKIINTPVKNHQSTTPKKSLKSKLKKLKLLIFCRKQFDVSPDTPIHFLNMVISVVFLIIGVSLYIFAIISIIVCLIDVILLIVNFNVLKVFFTASCFMFAVFCGVFGGLSLLVSDTFEKYIYPPSYVLGYAAVAFTLLSFSLKVFDYLYQHVFL